MSPGENAERAVCRGRVVKVQANRENLAEDRGRWLHVRNTVLDRPWTKSLDLMATGNRDRQVLVPRHLPVCIGRLVEQRQLRHPGGLTQGRCRELSRRTCVRQIPKPSGLVEHVPDSPTRRRRGEELVDLSSQRREIIPGNQFLDERIAQGFEIVLKRGCVHRYSLQRHVHHPPRPLELHALRFDRNDGETADALPGSDNFISEQCHRL